MLPDLCNPNQNGRDILHRREKKTILKFTCNQKRWQIDKTILSKGNTEDTAIR